MPQLAVPNDGDVQSSQMVDPGMDRVRFWGRFGLSEGEDWGV